MPRSTFSEAELLHKCKSDNLSTLKNLLGNSNILHVKMQSEEDEGDPFTEDDSYTLNAAARRMYDILAKNERFSHYINDLLHTHVDKRVSGSFLSTLIETVEEIARRTRYFDYDNDDVKHFQRIIEHEPLFEGEGAFVNKYELSWMPIRGTTHAVFNYYEDKHYSEVNRRLDLTKLPNHELDSTDVCLNRERYKYTYFTQFNCGPERVFLGPLDRMKAHGVAMRRAHPWFLRGYRPNPGRFVREKVLYHWWKLRQFVKTWAITEFWAHCAYAPSNDQIEENINNINESFDAICKGAGGEGAGKRRLQEEDTDGWVPRRRRVAVEDDEDWLADSDEEI